MRRSTSLVTMAGLALGAGVIAWAQAHVGGTLRAFAQPEPIAIVFGGTLAALLVSFPAGVLRAALKGVVELFTAPMQSIEALVPAFIRYARQVRRQGLMAVEHEAEQASDEFLARALTLSASGLSLEAVREALDIDARVCAERDDLRAQVFDAAAGYAPTLGIVGAVLGLMHVMQHLESGDVGTGIASAFVATVYGVGAANLLFLPLATRLRSRGRMDALRRELVIDGVLALQAGATPGVVEERLSGYVRTRRTSAGTRAA